MSLKNILKEKNISIYKLSKDSGIPYATCNDIINGKTAIEKSSAETVYHIAKSLNISMEDILAPCFITRSSFENFKSAICHQLKEKGDINFIIDTLKSNNIRLYYEKKWYPECLYLLAMLDYLCRINHISICNDYDDIRQYKLDKTIYPASIVALSTVNKNENILKQAENESIPEFKRFNIIENEVRNVI